MHTQYLSSNPTEKKEFNWFVVIADRLFRNRTRKKEKKTTRDGEETSRYPEIRNVKFLVEIN